MCHANNRHCRYIFTLSSLILLLLAVSVICPVRAKSNGGDKAGTLYAGKTKKAKQSKKTKKTDPALSAKMMKLTVGKSKTLRVKHAKKATWKILSGKKCVKITKKKTSLLIKGKKAGKARIQARVGKKKLVCKVTVKAAKKQASPEKEEQGSGGNGSDQPGGQKADIIDLSTEPVLGNFGFVMLRTLHKNGQKNVFLSPDSILSALSMTALGAGGETLKEMNMTMGAENQEAFAGQLKALHNRLETADQASQSDSQSSRSGQSADSLPFIMESPKMKYQPAHSIWTNKELIQVKNSFIEKNRSFFDAEVYGEPFDLTTVGKVNSWVSDKTDKMIPSIIDRLSPSDRMILINAICFEGEWENPYDDSQVTDGIFTTKTGGKKKVKMLNGRDRGSYYMELAGGRGFVKYYKVPYGYTGGQLAFFAFLPPEGQDVDAYLAKLSGANFRRAYADRMDRILLTRLPVFSLDYSASLKEPLQSMGMKLAFTDQADFSGISDQPVCIDDVLHKTHIELDQNGTKAAAVTAVIAKAAAAYEPVPPRTETIYLDRPFVYGIMDSKTGQPLFLGVADELGN